MATEVLVPLQPTAKRSIREGEIVRNFIPDSRVPSTSKPSSVEPISPGSKEKLTTSPVPLESLVESVSETSPYLEIIRKRVKYIKKKLQKIERYEQLEPSSLNPDQIQTIEHKSEVVCTLKELELIYSQVLAVDLEDKKKVAEEIEKAKSDAERRYLEDIGILREDVRKEFLPVFEALYASNVLYPRLNILECAISTQESDAITFFSKIVNNGALIANSRPCTSLEYVEFLKMLAESHFPDKDKLFFGSSTYSDLYNAVQVILNTQVLFDPACAPEPNDVIERQEEGNEERESKSGFLITGDANESTSKYTDESTCRCADESASKCVDESTSKSKKHPSVRGHHNVRVYQGVREYPASRAYPSAQEYTDTDGGKARDGQQYRWRSSANRVRGGYRRGQRYSNLEKELSDGPRVYAGGLNTQDNPKGSPGKFKSKYSGAS